MYVCVCLRSSRASQVPGIGPVMRDTLTTICATRLDSFEPVYLADLQRLSVRELEPMGSIGCVAADDCAPLPYASALQQHVAV